MAGSEVVAQAPFEPADIAFVEAVPATELAQREAKGLPAGPEKGAEGLARGHPTTLLSLYSLYNNMESGQSLLSRYNDLADSIKQVPCWQKICGLSLRYVRAA